MTWRGKYKVLDCKWRQVRRKRKIFLICAAKETKDPFILKLLLWRLH